MATKRDNNAGSISRRGKKYRAQVTTGHNPDTGKLTRISKSFINKADAQRWITEQANALNTGAYIAPKNYTIKSWCDEWLHNYKYNIKPNTRTAYLQVLKRHVYPTLGDTRLQALESIDIQRIVIRMSKDNISTRSVSYAVTILKAALQQAVDTRVIPTNVAIPVRKPRIEPFREITYLESDNDRVRLVTACRGERIGAAYILMLFTGLRRGECLGLRWTDVNFSENYISVAQSLCRVEQDVPGEPKTRIEIGTPKTKSSKRTIPVPAFVMELLAEYRRVTYAEQERAGELYQPSGLVFVTDAGGHIEPRNFARKFTSIQTKANEDSEASKVNVNLHALRHTFTSMLYELEVSPLLVKFYLGHSNSDMTAHYTHLSKTEKRKGADKLEAKYRPLICTEPPPKSGNI